MKAVYLVSSSTIYIRTQKKRKDNKQSGVTKERLRKCVAMMKYKLLIYSIMNEK